MHGNSAYRVRAIEGCKTPLTALGEFEKTVHLYDVSKRKKVGQLETVLDFGGRRLSLSPDGRFLAAGAYT